MNSAPADAGAGAELPIDSPAAPPRSNGELVFAAPWESRVFGITMALVEDGRISWREFQRRLIAEIAVWERSRDTRDEPYRYYERWQAALEQLLASDGLCSADELLTRVDELAARPHGSDHRSHHRDDPARHHRDEFAHDHRHGTRHLD